MKLKFKKQAFQTRAVESVVDCFKGQPDTSAIRYRIDPGAEKANAHGYSQLSLLERFGFKNGDIILTEPQILENIQEVQRLQNLPQSEGLIKTKVSPLNLDVEMETGTGKTYCYIKNIFEMNKRFGWTKFIVVVPSIAIREGVYKSLEITSDHFQETYGKKARFFIYNSRQLHNLESFSSDAGINVMVINVQAFNARGKDNHRIYEELDDFQSRRPIDVIKANRPILILDEPQKMEGAKTLDGLEEFNPLFILRYSATHKTRHNVNFLNRPRNYVLAARELYDIGEYRDSLMSARRALENLAEKTWYHYGKYSDKSDSPISVARRAPNQPWDLRCLADNLKSKFNKSKVKIPKKDQIVSSLSTVLGDDAKQPPWAYLNKGTHDETDLPEFDQHVVNQIVTALEQLDSALR